jgi:hypothetical protein
MMGTVSGTVHLRPARVGLLTGSKTDAVVRRASALACSAWGGVYYPILTASDPDLPRTTERLAVDFLYPLDDDRETRDLCDAAGLRWRGRSPWGPFDPVQDGFTTRLLPPDRLQFADVRPRVLPVWEAGDPHAALYEVWLGHHLDDAEGMRQAAAYRDDATVVELPLSNEFPDLGDVTTPVSATGAGLFYTGDGAGAVFVLVGDDPQDLDDRFPVVQWS